MDGTLGRDLLNTYFKTFDYPFTRHHIDSFDQFIAVELPSMIKSNNPLLLMKDFMPELNQYRYKLEIFVGGVDGTRLRIGTPTVSLQKTKEVRLLFPNEARLRNLTYSASIFADIEIRLTIRTPGSKEEPEPVMITFENIPLFRMPIMLHSRYCLLHGKPSNFLKEAGECDKDQGGYFVIEGAEKILVTRQEQAFNTLYCQRQDNDPKVETYATITCLSPLTRDTRIVAFYWMRSTETIHVSLPFVRANVPLFVLFRAMGLQNDQDILELLYPDLDGAEAQMMAPLLLPSIAEAQPFHDRYAAIQFLKVLTKGYSEAHILDILYNQLFIHIQDRKASRIHFLAECVRKFLRVHTKFDPRTDRDDTRNQRVLPSGFLIRRLFQNAYNLWKKAAILAIDREYSSNTSTYSGERFRDLFSPGNVNSFFLPGFMTQEIMRGFKGKWLGSAGCGRAGEEATGVLQSMSRLSYLDFMSHCRRVILDFDTSMKLTGPRQLHTSQYGYFCTSETPSGATIGVTKNLSLMTLISNNSDPRPLINMLIGRGWVIPCSEMRIDLQKASVPVFLNNGILGYTVQPKELTHTLKLLKWTACLPALSSIVFNIRDRRITIYIDEGRPARPLIHLDEGGTLPAEGLQKFKSWRDLVCGTFPLTAGRGISTTSVIDPLAETAGPLPFTQYRELLEAHCGVIEYVDPYEQNETFIVNFKENITPDASHMEIHPCTIVSVLTSMIPFANHNQSPRNQLSCSQSKQGLSIYATNFQNRYDNSANILCYGEAPLVRTYLYDVLAEGKMPYGNTIILAMGCYTGFNRDDGIIFNADSVARGLFRSINYRTYEAFEEKDEKAKTELRIANPARIPAWLDLRPGLDYTKLDERGIIKTGEYVDENTVLVGRYIQAQGGILKDSSITPQVWTSGRVESVIVTVNNTGHRLVKIRIVQDRVPELGDKFSNRHGQKGTIGMLIKGQDMPRTKDGLVPDMIMNPHAIPSRMTIAQLLEMIFGKAVCAAGAIGDATLFMNDSTVTERISNVLQNQFAMEKYGNEILYNGMTGTMMETSIFMGPIYTMRLKHMVEDKWNARAEGRREQRTHQPTGGRGNQGGLRIGEMERDAIACHGTSEFLNESFMKRSDGTVMRICNGCGTVPIYNDTEKIFVCPLCDGPVQYIGSSMETLQIMPPTQRSIVTASDVTIPYAMKVLNDELGAFMNMGLRFLTGKHLKKLYTPPLLKGDATTAKELIEKPMPDLVFPETRVPELAEEKGEIEAAPEDLAALGAVVGEAEVVEPGGGAEAATAAAAPVAAVAPPLAPENMQVAFAAPTRPLTPGFGSTGVGATTTPPFYGMPPPAYAAPQDYGAAASFYPPRSPEYGAATPPNFSQVAAQYPPASPAYGAATPAYGAATPPNYNQYPPASPAYAAGTPPYSATTPPNAAAQGPPFLNLGPAAPAAPPAPPVQVLAPPMPGGPVTLVVEGASAAPEEAPLRGGMLRRHHVTPRQRLAREPRGPSSASFGEGPPPAPSQRISIRKMN